MMKKAKLVSVKLPYIPQGGTRSIHDGRRGLTYLFELKICILHIFFWSKDLSCTFLGLKNVLVFLGQCSSNFFV